MKARYGLSDNATDELSNLLSQLLANYFALNVKTLHCHWNVEGPRFLALHEMFESEYSEILKFTDEIAERIRMMGKKVPASLKRFSDQRTLQEIERDLSGDEMLEELSISHEELIREIRELIKASENHADPGTIDMLSAPLRFHEKTAWFLRSHLK